MATKTKALPKKEKVSELKEPVQEQKKYEYILSQEKIQALDSFIQPSMQALSAGVLDAPVAFTKLVNLLRENLEPREIK